ncbi:bifunctional 4-hydroxy-2-oxoglutarate aldolase/2-dehydro-3-deoxy-phosphogluconate aldolase [Enterovibrio sp. 27052020O]|uniref:bifunctional 4-hydroxy-2-oxoglutarate aldolase/2-dehydro-3-deoxy-phosphogluconate aldolase n=1 Tax=Enterovibrio sp. 27052020O TaxID=3241166 RepID=UPI00388DF532
MDRNQHREETLRAIEAHKIFAIVRGIDAKHVRPTMDALYRGGIRLVEVTFDRNAEDSQTLEVLRILTEEYGDRLIIGAGTVTHVDQVSAIQNIGASFVVSPDTNVDVIKATRAAHMVSLPGAMTASEAVTAHNAGADFIKLFPGGLLGPEYLKALAAPLSDLKFIAVGGVDANNLAAFAKAGAVGFGIGSNLVNNTLIESNAFEDIYHNACRYTQALKLLEN